MATVTRTLTVNAAFLREIKDDNHHLHQLLSTLRELTGNPVVARGHQQRVVKLLGEIRDQLLQHEQNENSLMLEALDTDIGGEG